MVEMTIHGLDDLARQLKELPERVARNALRAAVYAGASVVRKEVKARAPVATGKLKAAVYQKQIREHSNVYTQVFFVGVRSGARRRRTAPRTLAAMPGTGACTKWVRARWQRAHSYARPSSPFSSRQ